VLEIIGDESKLMVEGDGGDGGVGGRQGDALASIVTLQQTRHTGNWPNNWEVLQALKEFHCASLFVGPKAGADFRNVDRAAGQQMTLLQKCFANLAPIPFAVQSVNNDTCIEKECGHVSGL